MSEYVKGSSDEFIDANIQLALAVVRKLQQKRETQACMVFPDKPEKRRASQLFKAALDSIDGISIGSLDDVPSGAVTTFFKSIKNTLDFDFEDENEGLHHKIQLYLRIFLSILLINELGYFITSNVNSLLPCSYLHTQTKTHTY
ncbi:hypothetical protein CRYUN_Cryun34aG0097200 [Craigia yunnanensis]